MTNYPKGSDGAAEQKSRKYFAIGAGVVYLAVIFLFFVFKTDVHAFVSHASIAWNIIGFILITAGFALAGFSGWLQDRFEISRTAFVLALILIVLGVCSATGFNFDYFTLKH